MSRSDHRRRDRPARASVFTDAAIRQALLIATAPLTRTDIHKAVVGDSPTQEYTSECLGILVERGKVIRFGSGDLATYWLRERPLHVSRIGFHTKPMA